ncbi:ABC-2 type transport system permease protein [Prauserella shujinwangii]|uniref:ABC-2 type transport system permease protein n=1 Tax=Prauserella shujinwangii TaxID=1453103 RepID=A0A2T0LZA5_9PSEU|nr:ABC transporter permease [Prauserella shujinwangii]PRX49447.1 ABC-2 type transport system permease protein [Prauserella shujinwangii]
MTVTEERERTRPRPATVSGSSSFRALSVAMFKGFVRDKATLFFTFLFPLMFLLIFGLIFGNQGASKTEVGVVGEGQVIQALERSEAVELKRMDSAEAAEQQVRSGDLPAFVAQDGTDVTLRFAASDRTRAGTVYGIVRGVVDRVNVAATGQPPRFELDSAQVEDSSLKPIQYLAPGLMSWAVSIAAVFGAALTFVNWRKKQVLRRLRLAPVWPLTVLGSRLVVSLGVALLQFGVFVGIALLPVFGLQLSGQWWLAVPLLLLGTLAFFSVGMLIGALCKTEESANGASNLVVLPMAFLSGAFFPTDLMPQWLQNAAQVLPMRHLNEGMLDVMVRGEGVDALAVPALVLVAFTAVLGLLAAKLFRWED